MLIALLTVSSSVADKVIQWLLDPDQPSLRGLTLTRHLGKRDSDPEVQAAQRALSTDPWVMQILGERTPGGWWGHPKNRLEPRFHGTHWSMLALADLGATRAIPEVAASCERWMSNSPLQGGGIGGLGKGKGHHCYTANMTRALLRMGYADDPRVRKTMEWLVRTAHPKGGWSCRFSTCGPAVSRTLDAW